MKKLSYEEKPRLTIRKTKDGYSVVYIDSNSRRIWRGLGLTQLAAWYALERLLLEHQVNLHKEYIRRDLERPDTGLGASDYHIATSNLPWWRRLFRI